MITVNGFVRSNSGSLSIQSGNAVAINQSLTSNGGDLTVATGNFGGITSGISGSMTSNNGALSVTTGNLAGAIQLAGPLNAFSTGAARDVSVDSKNTVTLAAITNTNGSVTVKADSGVLQLNGAINVNGGDILIQQRGISVADRIVFGNFINVSAISPNPSKGNVTVAVTALGAIPQVAGTPPAGGTTNQIIQSGGRIFFGPVQFANSGTTTLFAKGADITFFVDPGRGAANAPIQLNSNFFFADPPSVTPVPSTPVVPVSSSGMSSLLVPSVLTGTTASKAAATHVPAPMTPFTGGMTTTAPASMTGSAPAAQANPVLSTLASTGPSGGTTLMTVAPTAVVSSMTSFSVMATTVTQSAAAEKLTGYSYGSGREADPATNLTSVLTGFVSKKAGLCTGGRNHVRAGNDAVLHARGPEVLEVQHGELLLSASKRTHVSIGTHRVEAAPGVIVHVVKFGDVLMVRNLCDASAKSVAVMIDGKAIHVRPGEELVLGPDGFTTDDTIKGDSIGRRNVDRFTVAGKHAVIRSEFSIVGLIQQSRLLTAMYTKGSPADRAVMERVMKMAAALFQITGKRGAYSAYVPSKVETIAVNPERKRLPH